MGGFASEKKTIIVGRSPSSRRRRASRNSSSVPDSATPVGVPNRDHSIPRNTSAFQPRTPDPGPRTSAQASDPRTRQSTQRARYHPLGSARTLRHMSPFSPTRPRHPIRVVLSSDALLPFMSVRKAAALAIAQLGVGAFFIAGVTGTALGPSAAWFVLAATLLAAFVRAIDVESWALLIPGGFVARVTSAFGARACRPRQGRRPGRAPAARRIRLGRDRALPGQRVRNRDCRMALHRVRHGRKISPRSSPSR